MSDLLNSASLVLIPSGYKEDIVYSAVPTDGSGDLSFTRASNGTRVNSAGLVEVCPWNLLQYSEDFTNAYWNKYQATVTANAITAPNGTTTADKLEFTAPGTAVLFTTSTALQSQVYTLSCYGKKGTSNFIQLGFTLSGGDKAAQFNINTGVVSTVDSGVTASIESVGDGWYRCQMYLTTDINTPNIFVNATTGTTGNFIYIWGAQINIGSTAKPYFPTTDRLNVPRLTYQNGGGGCPSLLLEKQSTNLQLYSQELDNAYWNTFNLTVTGNSAISPDGTQNADLLSFDVSATARLEKAVGGTYESQTHTVSVYAKVTSGTQQFRLKCTHANVADYYSSDLTVTTEWQRFTFTQTFGASVGTGIVSGVINSSSGTAKSILFYGFQLEANSSYATSYIPTTSASATRVVDACFRNSYAGGITSEGTIFADFEYLRTDGGYATACLIINGSNYIYMFVIGNTIRANCTNGGVVQSQIISSTVTPNTRYKVAARFKTNDFSLYVNGALIGTDTSGTMPTFSTSFNTYVGTDSSFTEPVGKLNELVIFPVGLTNSELASLTTI
jgi:hypothetical protein